MKGRSDCAAMVNSQITEHINTANHKLEAIRSIGSLTCNQISEEVLSSVKTAITGKAKRGKKKT